jgi:hypothetical protein
MKLRAACVWLALALGGCASEPAYPLLTPLAVAQHFGFAETPPADGKLSVTYYTPARLAFGPVGPGASEAEAARALGFDMALWRAAQIAAQHGDAGFRVADRQADVTIYPDPLDIAFPPPYWGPGWTRWGDPAWGIGTPWLPPRLLVAARVTIAVALLPAPGPADYDAAATIVRLRQTYPGADGAAP